MIELPEGFDSIFRYINVVAQRSEQLINGAKPRSEARFTKLTLMAKQDVDQGLVDWRVLTQEELDAQRQAVVDQFRAEMGGEEQAEKRAAEIADVLPTAAVERPAAKPARVTKTDDRDEELERLQRLLGLGGSDENAGDDDLDGSDEFDLAGGDDVDLGDDDADEDDDDSLDDDGDIDDDDEDDE